MPYVRTQGRWVKIQEIPYNFLEIDLTSEKARRQVTAYAEANRTATFNCSDLSRMVNRPQEEIEAYKPGTIIGDNGEIHMTVQIREQDRFRPI